MLSLQRVTIITRSKGTKKGATNTNINYKNKNYAEFSEKYSPIGSKRSFGG